MRQISLVRDLIENTIMNVITNITKLYSIHFEMAEIVFHLNEIGLNVRYKMYMIKTLTLALILPGNAVQFPLFSRFFLELLNL